MAKYNNAYAIDDNAQMNTWVTTFGHPYRPETNGICDQLSTVLAVPVPISSAEFKGPFERGAIGWKQHEDTYQHGRWFRLALQLFAHGLELKNNGTPSFTAKAGSQGRRRQQLAFIRALEGRMKKGDHDHLTKIVNDLYFDPVISEALVPILRDDPTLGIPRGGRVPEGRPDEDDIMDGMEVDNVARAVRGAGGGRGRGGRRGGGGGGDGDGDGDEPRIELDPDSETDTAILRVLDQLCEGHEGREYKEKVEVVVVEFRRPARKIGPDGEFHDDDEPVRDARGKELMEPKIDPRTGRQEQDAETGELKFKVVTKPRMESAGCIVFFCVRDPMFSVGKMISALIGMCEEHRRINTGVQVSADSGGKFGGGGDDFSAGSGPFSRGRPGGGGGGGGSRRLSKLCGQFPWITNEEHADDALHYLSFEEYINLVSFIRDDPTLVTTGRTTAEGRGLEDPGTEMHPNPLAPVNVFTVAWACKVMNYFGVPVSQCNPDRFFRPEGVLQDVPIIPQPRPAAQPLYPEEEEEEDDEQENDEEEEAAVGEDEDGEVRDNDNNDDEDDINLDGIPDAVHVSEHVMQSVGLGRVTGHIVVQFPPNRSYMYPMDAFVWARNGYYGLSRQMFPWVKIPNALQKYMSPSDPSHGQELVDFEGLNDRNKLAPNYTQAMIKHGKRVCDPLPKAPYDPHSIARHDSIRTVALANRAAMACLAIPMGIGNGYDINRWNHHCAATRRERLAAILRVQQILKPSEHISPILKVILAYAKTEVKYMSSYLPHFTWDVTKSQGEVEVQELDSFAHRMIQNAIDVRYNRHIVSQTRHWQIVHYGSFDCYRTTDVDLHISCIFHGQSQTGKSHLVKDATIRTCIEKTVQTQLQASNKSANVHHDITHVIVFKDEVEDFVVNAKAAERDKSGRAERDKSVMTDQKATYSILIYTEPKGNGRQVRAQELVETSIHMSLMCCTNKKVGAADEAMTSRFLNFVSTRRDNVNLYEYFGIKEKMDEMDQSACQDAVKALRAEQTFVAIIVAMIDGIALPDVSMDVFDAIMSRMMSFMEKNGVDSKEIRGISMVRNLARIYTFINAKLMLYDVPGAPFAGREFNVEQLIEAVPYLWCTKQIAMFAVTQLSEIFVHPIRDAVLRATAKAASMKYEDGKSLEDYVLDDPTLEWLYVDSQGHPVAAKEASAVSEGASSSRNFNAILRPPGESLTEASHPHPGASSSQRQMFRDFNYICVQGGREDCNRLISMHSTGVKVGMNEVEESLHALSNMYVEVDRIEPVSLSMIAMCRQTNQPLKLVRAGKRTKIPVVRRLYDIETIAVAVEAIGKLDDNLLLEAVGACIHDKFSPQSLLMGIHPEELITLISGEKRAHTFTGLYLTLDMDPQVRNMLSTGESFETPNVAFMPAAIKNIMTGPSKDPSKANDPTKDYTSEMFAAKTKRATASAAVEEDLDEWGYKEHHRRTFCSGVAEHGPGNQRVVFSQIRKHLKEEEDRVAKAKEDIKALQARIQAASGGGGGGGAGGVGASGGTSLLGASIGSSSRRRRHPPAKDKGDADADDDDGGVRPMDSREDASANVEQDPLVKQLLKLHRDARRIYTVEKRVSYPRDFIVSEKDMLAEFDRVRTSADASQQRREIYNLLCEQWTAEYEEATLKGQLFIKPCPVEVNTANVVRNRTAFRVASMIEACPAGFLEDRHGVVLRRSRALQSKEDAIRDKHQALALTAVHAAPGLRHQRLLDPKSVASRRFVQLSNNSGVARETVRKHYRLPNDAAVDRLIEGTAAVTGGGGAEAGSGATSGFSSLTTSTASTTSTSSMQSVSTLLDSELTLTGYSSPPPAGEEGSNDNGGDEVQFTGNRKRPEREAAGSKKKQQLPVNLLLQGAAPSTKKKSKTASTGTLSSSSSKKAVQKAIQASRRGNV